MIARTQKADVQQASTQKRIVDIAGTFQTPSEYKSGARKRLNNFNPAGWWLNVDYVTSEVTA